MPPAGRCRHYCGPETRVSALAGAYCCQIQPTKRPTDGTSLGIIARILLSYFRTVLFAVVRGGSVKQHFTHVDSRIDSVLLQADHPIPLFVLPERHPHPQCPTESGPGGRRLPGKWPISYAPPPPPSWRGRYGWRSPPAGGMHPRCFSHWWLTFRPGFVLRPGDIYFS